NWRSRVDDDTREPRSGLGCRNTPLDVLCAAAHERRSVETGRSLDLRRRWNTCTFGNSLGVYPISRPLLRRDALALRDGNALRHLHFDLGIQWVAINGALLLGFWRWNGISNPAGAERWSAGSCVVSGTRRGQMVPGFGWP